MPDFEWNQQKRWHPSPFLYTKESVWTSTWAVMTMNATSYQQQWSDCHDMNRIFLRKPREHSQWSLNDWVSCGKWRTEEPTKKFQNCLNPNSSRHISYLRAIQGHSRNVVLDPELQENVLVPKGFTEYIYHVGNANYVHWVMRSGLILGKPSLERGRQSVFFITMNPMEDEYCMEETPCDLTKPRVVPFNNTWQPHHNTIYCCTRWREKIAPRHTRAVCIEKMVCMEEGWTIPKKRLMNSKIGLSKINKRRLKNILWPTKNQRVPVKPEATPRNKELLVDLFLQMNSMTHIVKTQSNSWSRRTRTTRTKNPSFKT